MILPAAHTYLPGRDGEVREAGSSLTLLAWLGCHVSHEGKIRVRLVLAA